MKHHCLSKSYLFSRVVSKWKEKNSFRLTNTGVYVLFALHEVTKQKRGATIAEVQAHLKRNKHSMGTNFIVAHLETLRGYQLVDKDGMYPVRYQLTIYGRNAISSLETALRQGRVDK